MGWLVDIPTGRRERERLAAEPAKSLTPGPSSGEETDAELSRAGEPAPARELTLDMFIRIVLTTSRPTDYRGKDNGLLDRRLRPRNMNRTTLPT